MFFKNYSFRPRYFLNHLCLSFAIGSLTAFTVYAVWYPGLLAKAVGVSHIFLLLLCIDVIAGPLMTLFLAKEGKKGVWFDLTAVIIIQFIALIYGIWHIAEGRPAWQVINIYRVELVSALDMQYDHAKPPFSGNSWGSPGWALVRPAKDKVEQSDWLWQELEGMAHLRSEPSYLSRLMGIGSILIRKLSRWMSWNVTTQQKLWLL